MLVPLTDVEDDNTEVNVLVPFTPVIVDKLALTLPLALAELVDVALSEPVSDGELETLPVALALELVALAVLVEQSPRPRRHKPEEVLVH